MPEILGHMNHRSSKADERNAARQVFRCVWGGGGSLTMGKVGDIRSGTCVNHAAWIRGKNCKALPSA